jgi:uncharacterized protein YuzE
MVKIQDDAEGDTPYTEFHPLAYATAEARPLSDELTANCGLDGKSVGLEILDASWVLGQTDEDNPLF